MELGLELGLGLGLGLELGLGLGLGLGFEVDGGGRLVQAVALEPLLRLRRERGVRVGFL